MILRRSEILAQIALGNPAPGSFAITAMVDPTSARSAQHSMPSNLRSAQCHKSTKKVTPGVTARIDELISANRTILSAAIAQIVIHMPSMPRLSASTVDSVRHQLGYQFLPPIRTFPLAPDQIIKRFEFVMANLATDLSKTIFTHENSFVLGARC
jgi:hypothetical protein